MTKDPYRFLAMTEENRTNSRNKDAGGSPGVPNRHETLD